MTFSQNYCWLRCCYSEHADAGGSGAPEFSCHFPSHELLSDRSVATAPECFRDEENDGRSTGVSERGNTRAEIGDAATTRP